jgi:hypothetical protein
VIPWVGALSALFYLLLFVLIMGGLYAVVRGAVRTALDDHFRKVQWYEQTGLWYSGRPPKGLPGAEQLSRAERKELPADARPERGS